MIAAPGVSRPAMPAAPVVPGWPRPPVPPSTPSVPSGSPEPPEPSIPPMPGKPAMPPDPLIKLPLPIELVPSISKAPVFSMSPPVARPPGPPFPPLPPVPPIASGSPRACRGAGTFVQDLTRVARTAGAADPAQTADAAAAPFGHVARHGRVQQHQPPVVFDAAPLAGAAGSAISAGASSATRTTLIAGSARAAHAALAAGSADYRVASDNVVDKRQGAFVQDTAAIAQRAAASGASGAARPAFARRAGVVAVAAGRSYAPGGSDGGAAGDRDALQRDGCPAIDLDHPRVIGGLRDRDRSRDRTRW